MSAGVSTIAGPDGRRLASKWGATAHEAQLLDKAQHPGVVELVTYDGDTSTLHTVFAGSHSLATVGPLDLGRVITVVASLAATLADLHALGIVHGRVEPSHVVVGAGGRPLLCGFAGAGLLGAVAPPCTGVPVDFADPASERRSPLDTRSDVYGLGALIRFLLLDHGHLRRAGRPCTGWRTGWRTAWRRRGLLGLADQATAEDPRQRPSAADIAATVATSAPDGERLTRATGAGRHRRAVRRARARSDGSPSGPWFVALAGIIVLLIGLLGLAALRGRHDGSPPPSPGPADPGPAAAPEADPSADIAAPGSDAQRPATATTTLVMGEERRQDTAVTVVAAGGQRYAVGEDGDRTIVGDWDCDGADTVALLRPRTGEVFVFRAWATAGHDLTVPTARRIDGARRLLADDDVDGCDRLLAERHDGAAVEVTT